MPSGWNGRKVPRLVGHTLATKGTVCHLCGLEGADSADHEPPRSTLEATVADPDHPAYLWPAHLLCNKRRGARPITDALRAELLTARMRDVAREVAHTNLSPRFARVLEATRGGAPR